MLYILSFLYQVQNYDLSNKSKIEVEYEVDGKCNAVITFMKGYDIYKINTEFDGKGLKLLDVNSAKLVPTRRKPIPIPLTIEGDCIGKILKVDFK